MATSSRDFWRGDASSCSRWRRSSSARGQSRISVASAMSEWIDSPESELAGADAGKTSSIASSLTGSATSRSIEIAGARCAYGSIIIGGGGNDAPPREKVKLCATSRLSSVADAASYMLATRASVCGGPAWSLAAGSASRVKATRSTRIPSGRTAASTG